MIVEVEFVDGLRRFFKTEDYRVSTYKEFFADCLKITVRAENGKKLKVFKRPFKWWYKHVTFKTEKVQKILKEQVANLNKEEAEE